MNCEEFESVSDARSKATWWRREYNEIRPHSSLSYKTPKVFSAECDRGLHAQPPMEERKLVREQRGKMTNDEARMTKETNVEAQRHNDE